MPKLPVPDHFRDLLLEPVLGHIATVDHEGRPQVNPVWFLWDGTNLSLSLQASTRKYQNLRENPATAISIVDPDRPGRYLEIRGDVIDWELFLTLDYVNLLSQKYTGENFDENAAGQERYKVTIAPRSWTGQD